MTAAVMSPRRSRPRVRKGARPEAAGGLPREHVGEIQRVRILMAMAEVASERGAGSASVAHIVARAGVSRRTFYDLFEDREDCFLATFDEIVARAAIPVLDAYGAHAKWRDRIRAGLLALLVFFDEEPALARFCVVEVARRGTPRVGASRGDPRPGCARGRRGSLRAPRPSPRGAPAGGGGRGGRCAGGHPPAAGGGRHP